MGRPKKQIKEESVKKEPIICTEDLDEDIESEENSEDNIKNGEILVGSYFKITVRDRYYEIYEKKKTKTKDSTGNEIEVELFKTQGCYFGNLVSACNHLKQYMAKNKIHEKGTIDSLDNAIKVIKESYKETQKMFEGIEGI